MNNELKQPGNLVHYRNRDWMVLPSDDENLLHIKPLGGSDAEQTAVYLPIALQHEKITPTQFAAPKPSEMGSFSTARLLFDAARLSFRNAAGPFRCMAKLSFRPRSYQMVPLVMALKQDKVRLMIADDVGIGKTIEALLILKEMMERGEVKKFAVICPPHLCEQWQTELKDKLDIEAEIIRSSTAAKLDRRIPDDNTVFYHIPYQVISIDYIKADKRRGMFIKDCPDFIIVDEAHTCALPDGSKSSTQQLRYNLLSELVKKKTNLHLLLLTATPHSGKDEEFASLLSLLNEDFKKLDIEKLDKKQQQQIAKHFIQRKRKQIKQWLDEETHFPERDPKEIHYNLTTEYLEFYKELTKFARGISSVATDNDRTRLLRSWAAIALLKGAMSSPAMAADMLMRRREKLEQTEETEFEIPEISNTLFEDLESTNDLPSQDLFETVDFKKNELVQLQSLQQKAMVLGGAAIDSKLANAIRLILEWIKEGFDPIIFCHYVATAHYVAAAIKEALPKNIHVEAITSELADEQRKERIEVMGKASRRVLVATDWLSEGINLQEYFTAVLHYDLPWNPNRLEQREGRVDRFGQTAPLIKTYLLIGEDNAMDTFVLEVLIRKVKEIQKSIGVSINIGVNNKNLMATAAQRILHAETVVQQSLFADTENAVSNELDKARLKGENLIKIFTHESIDKEIIKQDLAKVDEAIGNVQDVTNFVCQAVQTLGGVINHDGINGYDLQAQNLPPHIKQYFANTDVHKISFVSPTPKGYIYIGRNHRFVEQLCHYLLAMAFEANEHGKLARTCVTQTDAVHTKTTLVMFRVRNVIKEKSGTRETVAEEMYLWGYQTQNNQLISLDYTQAKALMLNANILSTLSPQRQEADMTTELQHFETIKNHFMDLATQRAEEMVQAHEHYKTLVGGKRYEKATPILPPDIMGVYILLPKPTAL
jgi:superfamily II DNA or RNA helicase